MRLARLYLLEIFIVSPNFRPPQFITIDNMETANKIFYLLGDFDNEIGRRVWEDNPEYGYPVHREHGWTLPNDD